MVSSNSISGRAVDAYQLFIQCNGKGGGGTEPGHFIPLPRTDGLFDGMELEFGKTM